MNQNLADSGIPLRFGPSAARSRSAVVARLRVRALGISILADTRIKAASTSPNRPERE